MVTLAFGVLCMFWRERWDATTQHNDVIMRRHFIPSGSRLHTEEQRGTREEQQLGCTIAHTVLGNDTGEV